MESALTAEEFAAAADVSRETLERLRSFDALLLDWNSRHNLVARSTIPDRWRRHYLDSAQLYPLIPRQAGALADLGSGAGLPGLVLAAMAAERPLAVTLIESVGKKAAFLNAAAAAMGLGNVTVLHTRVEEASLPAQDVLTARALAPLPRLLQLAAPLAREDTLCLFLKGQDVEAELTAASKSWDMEVERRPSMTSPGSAVLLIKRLARKRK
jgi:16S rRNA (guanine527-N7)-methyltransferase